jgi:S1-C subfamily serine protease
VDIRGFSGAPIVDDAGLVVGVMTVWFQPKMDGELWTEAGGEDALSALKALRHK